MPYHYAFQLSISVQPSKMRCYLHLLSGLFMALTIRPTDEQLDILAKVQRMTAELTYSKAIFKGLSEYIQLKKDFDELEKKHNALLKTHAELRETVNLYVMAKTRLNRVLQDDAKTDNADQSDTGLIPT